MFIRKFGSVATKTQLPTTVSFAHLAYDYKIKAGTVYGNVHTVTLIPGDGIGQEMADVVKKVFVAANVPVHFEQFDLSGDSVADPALLAKATESIRRNKIALKGILHTALGTAGSQHSLNIALRKDLDIYASLIHLKNLNSNSEFKTRHNGIDICLIRENTEGEYSGLEHSPVKGVVEHLKVVTRVKTERIARFAFDFALKNGRKQVTAIHKANIMKLGDGLFLNVCKEVAREYASSGIVFNDMIVDNAAMQFVSKPQQFDVVVAGNLYGTILGNIGAALVGGPGMVPGANVGREFVVFEPGCRHVGLDIKGMDKANPTALLMSAVHMLRHLGLQAHADKIDGALRGVISEAKVLTADIGGKSGTGAFCDAVIAKL